MDVGGSMRGDGGGAGMRGCRCAILSVYAWRARVCALMPSIGYSRARMLVNAEYTVCVGGWGGEGGANPFAGQAPSAASYPIGRFRISSCSQRLLNGFGTGAALQ